MGTAVLVHGGWANPDDWIWVTERLESTDVRVLAPDLPSHQGRGAGRADDVKAVAEAIATAERPVVVVGWSYGAAVVSELVDTAGIDRLVYLGAVPKALSGQAQEAAPNPGLTSHLLVQGDTVVLDNEWWLTDGPAGSYPPEILNHLRQHPRRPVTLTALNAPVAGEAWRTVPTSVLVGASDHLVWPGGSAGALLEWAKANLPDVRVVDGDHFLLWFKPDVVAGLILEAMVAEPL